MLTMVYIGAAYVSAKHDAESVREFLEGTREKVLKLSQAIILGKAR